MRVLEVDMCRNTGRELQQEQPFLYKVRSY